MQTYHTDANNKISGLSSKVSQNADSITSVVTNLSDSDKAKKNYSAIAQLQNDINLRVAKDDVVNQINISKESILIDGKKTHITGDTKIDKNVIVGGMIAAGSITADKLSASTMELTANQGIKGGGATLDANGLTVRGNDGSYVVHGSNGMEFHDGNGNTFAMVGATIMGTVKDGQWIKFTNPWKTVPNVIVTPISLQTAIPGYNSTNLYLDCRAQNVTVNGFQAACRTVLKAGSGGSIPSGKTIISWNGDAESERRQGKNGWKGPDSIHDVYRDDSISITLPSNATQAIFTFSVSLTTRTRASGGGEPTRLYTTYNIISGGKSVGSGDLGHSFTYDSTVSNTFTKPVSVNATGSVTISIHSWFHQYHVKNDSYTPLTIGSISISLSSYSFNTTADVALASGNAFFLCTDQHNSPYTISDSQ